MLEFEWPWIFVLLPLPWLINRLIPAAAQQEAALHVPFYRQMADTEETSTFSSQGNQLNLLLFAMLWLLLLVAASRPTWIGDPVALPATGRDLMLAVDLSDSMQQTDMILDNHPVTRIEVIKKVVSEFALKRQGDRLGLILFGTNAYLQAPLTFDRNTVSQLMNEAQLGFAGPYTAIGDAIGLTIKRLRKQPESSRILILLTDGQNTAGEIDPDQAAKLAAQEKIKIYTIGVGAEQMERQAFGGLGFGLFGSQTFNPSADLDEKGLTAIANATGGQYFRARSTEELAKIYDVLDKLEPVEQEAETFRPKQTLFYWPLGVAMVLSLVYATGYLLRQRAVF